MAFRLSLMFLKSGLHLALARPQKLSQLAELAPTRMVTVEKTGRAREAAVADKQSPVREVAGRATKVPVTSNPRLRRWTPTGVAELQVSLRDERIDQLEQLVSEYH